MIRLFSVETGELVRALGRPINVKPFRSPFFTYGVPCDDRIAFSPDGKTLVAVVVEVENRQQSGFIRFYDVASGEVARERRIQQPNPFLDIRTGFGVASLAFGKDGKLWLAWASSDGTARLYDAQSGKEIRRLPAIQNGVHTAFMFSPDRQFLAYRASNNPDVCIVGLSKKTATAVWQEKTNQINPHPSSRSFAFSPDGRILAEGLLGNAHKYWNVILNPQAQRLYHTRRPTIGDLQRRQDR